MADESGARPRERVHLEPIEPARPARRPPEWMSHRTVFRVALAIWLLAIVVRVVRDATGVSPTGTYIGFVVGITVLLASAVFSGYGAAMFLAFVVVTWIVRVNGFRAVLAGRARPFAKLREEGAFVVGVELFVEAFWWLGAVTFLVGTGSLLIMVGMVAWDGASAAWLQPDE